MIKRIIVTSKSLPQRWLHTIVSGLCGRDNSCVYERDGVRKPKIDYRSQQSAARAALDLTIKWGRDMDAYQCWYCRGWHVGNTHSLTFAKFLRIFWFWVLRKRRKGNKLRPWKSA